MDHRYTSDREILYDRETLQAFVLGKLDEKQMQEIAKAAETSEALAVRIEGMRLLLETAGEAGVQDFFNESWSQQEGLIEDFVRKDAIKSGPSRPPFLTYAVAAGIAFLLGLGAFLLNRMNSGGDLLENALTESFPLIHTQIVRGNAQEAEKWEEAYKNKDFARVVQALAAKAEKNEAENFYLGMAYLQQGQYVPAAEAYQQVINLNNLKGFLEQARWFAALAYIQLNRLPEARALLKTILEKDGHYKQVEAAQLREQYPLVNSERLVPRSPLLQVVEKV